MVKVYSIFILAAISLLACKSKDKTQERTKKESAVSATELQLSKEQFTNGSITIANVQVMPINKTIKLNGSIDVPPQNLVSITSMLGGYVKNIHLLPGQKIGKGEVIAIMEDPAYVQLQQDYLTAKAKLSFLDKEHARQKELAASEAASQKNYQQVTAEYLAEQVTAKALQEKLALIGIDGNKLTIGNISRTISIRSPIHGFVTKVPVNIGRYVNPTDVIAELVDPGDIHANLTVFEKDIAYLKEEQPVKITVIDNPEKTYPAEVLLVTKNLDENRAGLVHCHFHKYHPELLPGMFVNAEIELGQQQLPAVPEAAVVLYQGNHYVFMETGSLLYRLVEVQIGAKENGFIAITSNNIDWKNKKVVSNGAFALLGMLFKSEEAE